MPTSRFFVLGYNILICSDPAMAAGCPADLNGAGRWIIWISASLSSRTTRCCVREGALIDFARSDERELKSCATVPSPARRVRRGRMAVRR